MVIIQVTDFIEVIRFSSFASNLFLNLHSLKKLRMNQLKTTVKNNDLIYDIGLHQGQDTDFYLRKGFRVIAFEANPENAAFCRKKFSQAIKANK